MKSNKIDQLVYDAVYFTIGVAACFLIIVWCLTGCTPPPKDNLVTIVQPEKPAMCAGKKADGTVIIHECFP